MKNNSFFFIIIIFYFLSTFFASADSLNKITIIGNERVQSETIIEYGGIKLNSIYSTSDLNSIQKKIYNTGFFENISLSFKDNNLTIKVSENPLIDFFSIQGENNSDDLNKIYDSLSLKSNKIFSDYLLKNDLEIIKKYYQSRGFYNTDVTPRLSKLENNKINILITINKNQKLMINNINFIGDKKFSSGDLLDVISSSEHGWWKFLSNNTFVSSDRISYDKILLKNFYLDKGYFDAQITSASVNKINEDFANIVFSISSGKKYNFGILHIKEGENLLNQNAISFINLNKEKYLSKDYSMSNIKLFLKKIENYFVEEKFDFLTAIINENKNNNKIDLNLVINQSNKNYINLINITGNSLTNEDFIRSKLNFSEGDSYLDYKKNRSLDNLKSSRIFKGVTIKTENIPDNKVNINVNVQEQPTGSVSAGAGYGTEGASVGFGFQESNFLGKGVAVDSNIKLSTQRTEGSISTKIPDFLYSDKSLLAKIFATRINFNNTVFEDKKIGSSLETQYEIYNDIYFKPGFVIENDNISVESTGSSYIQSQKGSFNTLAATYTIEQDLRDTKVSTKNGTILGLSQQLATLGSDIPYLKNSLFGSSYKSLFSDKQTLNFKYGYTNIFSLSSNKEIILSDRLFAPYTFTKGFEPRGFGPRDATSGDYVGGNHLMYSLLSTTIPTPIEDSWNLKTIAFINGAKVWGTDNAFIQDSGSIRSAIGIGLEYKSPLGPMNVTFAEPLTKEATDKTKLFSIEIGTVF